ncbi:S8 family peptidase [Halobacillus amylolyticus]|uniref:S8 family peptidase n=1 Tax=Halobacillus amylolyticus TaxID=2932259 RepID=A0ABY4HHG7_9BACI|nr:S8 family peptidase [Halobacillus amylolyticus]UOR14189.1 S8 family peptidase [Halobacillus amylolyticus]
MTYDIVKQLPLDKRIITAIEEEIPSNITSIGAPWKWKQGYTGNGNIIAVLDSGCETKHPDLKERIVGGYNFTEDHNGDASIYQDLNGHGTHVAGILAGSLNNTGVVGVAPKSNLLVLKTLDHTGTGSVKALVEAINYAINWRGYNNERVRVICMSLGLKSTYPELHQVIKRAKKNNISIVAAAGNEGDGNIKTKEYLYPSFYKEVISVGSINEVRKVASFSNTNKDVSIYAPGVGIFSTSIDKGYTELSGTSMASPHVAGSIALLIEEYERFWTRKITEEEIFRILMEHTKIIKTNEKVEYNILDLSSSMIGK